MSGLPYAPGSARPLSFARARETFLSGAMTPRAYLERCLETIAAREPEIQAFVTLNLEGARAAADASTARYKAGRPLPVVDGLPVAIKDMFETEDMPTEMNSPWFRGWRSGRDAAHVHALRQGGAAIVGKTVTTELGMAAPGPTRNPWDLRRTPGGSSSGSAAAVGAGMLPVATGSQVRGSILRPASICGVIGNKPTFGAVHPGGGFGGTPSVGHLGLLTGTLADCWEITHFIAHAVGGAPGHPGLFGGPSLPAAVKPRRLLRQYTAGWERTDDRSKEVFETFLAELQRKGVEVVEPSVSPELDAYEALTTAGNAVLFEIMAWEGRWPLAYMVGKRPEDFGPNVRGPVQRTLNMTLEDYRLALARRRDLQGAHRALEGRVDGFIAPAHIGPGQIGQPPVGTPWYNDVSSLIGAPTYSLPLLAVDDVPFGVQLMGFEHRDEDLTAHAAWLLQAFGVEARPHGSG